MDVSLRTTFDREAERYDRARPAPPEALVEAMVGAGNLQAGARVLEVGCGTGQATRPLAERGLEVVALELGPALAALAQQNLADFLNVTVEQTAFEAFRTTDLFDALVSVQAFHWIEPETGLAHAASLLRPGGALPLAWHQDLSEETAFSQAADPIFNATRWGSSTPAQPPPLRWSGFGRCSRLRPTSGATQPRASRGATATPETGFSTCA